MIFSAIAQDHIAAPRNCTPLATVTHHGEGGVPGDGPYITFDFNVSENTIRESYYRCNGCPTSIAVGSYVSQLLIGRTIDQALLLDSNDIELLLGGLPEGKSYYANLAEKAIICAFQKK